MEVHDALRDGKAKAGAWLRGKRPRASSLERSKQGLEIRVADAWTVVLNGNPGRIPAVRDLDLDPGAGLAILDRVFDQVIEDFAHLYSIHQNRLRFAVLNERKSDLLASRQRETHGYTSFNDIR